MTDEEYKRRMDEIRRKIRIENQTHLEMMEFAKRMRNRFEPNHRHPEKTLW